MSTLKGQTRRHNLDVSFKKHIRSKHLETSLKRDTVIISVVVALLLILLLKEVVFTGLATIDTDNPLSWARPAS